MKKALLIFSSLLLTVGAKLMAQCPTGTGMIVTPLQFNGACFVNVQNAIPGSNVSIYNSGGSLLGQGTASASGQAGIFYTCANGPVTSAISVLVPPGQICANSTIASPIILPIKLVSFTAKLNANKKPLIEWKTAFEINSEKIELQKSDDGNNYTTFTTFSTGETSLSEKGYSYEDAAFTSGGTVYYRLKQTDLDGKVTYSKVVYVTDKSASEISLFPNPVKSSGQVFLKGVKAADVQARNIRVTSMTGQSVEFKIVGANAIQLAENSPRGIYVVRVNEKSLKLFVE
jgi:hypothetical protein